MRKCDGMAGPFTWQNVLAYDNKYIDITTEKWEAGWIPKTGSAEPCDEQRCTGEEAEVLGLEQDLSKDQEELPFDLALIPKKDKAFGISNAEGDKMLQKQFSRELGKQAYRYPHDGRTIERPWRSYIRHGSPLSYAWGLKVNNFGKNMAILVLLNRTEEYPALGIAIIAVIYGTNAVMLSIWMPYIDQFIAWAEFVLMTGFSLLCYCASMGSFFSNHKEAKKFEPLKEFLFSMIMLVAFWQIMFMAGIVVYAVYDWTKLNGLNFLLKRRMIVYELKSKYASPVASECGRILNSSFYVILGAY